MAGLLWLDIDRSMEGNVVLSQTGLIKRILLAMNIKECNRNSTPEDNGPIGKDLNFNACMKQWEYCSVVEMLLYLAGSTRPDITFAVR